MALFVVLFVAVGSVCAADVISDVNSDTNLNSEEIIVNSNGIDNCNEVINSQNSQISVDAVEETNTSDISNEISTVSASDVKGDTVITSTQTSNNVTIQELKDASENLVSYVIYNKKLPDTIMVGSKNISIAQFSYLVTYAINRLNAGYALDFGFPIKNYGVTEIKGDKVYVTAPTKNNVNAIINYAKNNGVMPSTINVSDKKVDFKTYTYALAKVLINSSTNNIQLNVLFDSSLFDSEGCAISELIGASESLKYYVNANRTLPSTVMVGSKNLTIAQFSYLVTYAINRLNAGYGLDYGLPIKNYDVIQTEGDRVNMSALTKNNVNFVINSAKNNSAMPSTINVNGNNVAFKDYTYAFAVALINSTPGKIPANVIFDSSVYDSKGCTIEEIINASKVVKSYIETNAKLPSTVMVGHKNITISQFSYLVAYALNRLKANYPLDTQLSIKNYSVAEVSGDNVLISSPSNTNFNFVINYAKNNSVMPSTINVSDKKVDFKTYTYGFISALISSTPGKVPANVTFDSSVYYSTTFTVNEIIAASDKVKKYVDANKTLPSTVKVGDKTVSIAQFSDLASLAIQYINSGQTTSKIPLINCNNGSEVYSINENPNKNAYLNVAKAVSNNFSNNGVAPNYVLVNSAKADFRVYTYAFAKILVWYNNNGKVLPATCTFDSSVFKNDTPTPTNDTTFTIAQILSASEDVKKYVESNKELPSTVTVGGKSISIAQYAALASKAVQDLNSGKSTSSTIKLINATGSSDTYYIDENVYTSNYVSAAKAVYNNISSSGNAPSYVVVPTNKADFRVYTYGFAKILVYYKNNGFLPNYCRFNSTAFKNDTPTPTNDTIFTIAQILSASEDVKKYVESNKELPSTVTVGGKSISIAQYAALASKAVQDLNSGKSTSSTIKLINATGSSDTYYIDENVYTSNYVSAAKAVYNNISSSGNAPSYVVVPTNKADFRVYTYGFAKILVYYKNNGFLPDYCRFNSTAFKNDTPTNDTTFTIAQIMTASNNVKQYVETYNKLPDTVTINGMSVSTAQFSYLASQAVYELYVNSRSTSYSIKLINATGNSAKYYINENVGSDDFISAAKNVSSYYSKNNAAISYVVVNGENADYRVYTYAFAKLLAYYKNNGGKAYSVWFNSTVFICDANNDTNFTVAEIIKASYDVKADVDYYKALPSTVIIGDYRVTIAQYSYLASMAVQSLNCTNDTSVVIKFMDVNGTNYKSDSCINPNKDEYVDAAKRVANYFKEYKFAPNTVNITLANGTSQLVDYRVYTYAFAKILTYYDNNSNTLPNTCLFDSSIFEGITPPSDLVYKPGINEKAIVTNLDPYLVLSGHCTANQAIRDLAASLTKNCKNDLEKATVIFNYVRDKIAYSSYYNSVKDAIGTLSSKSANCCDQTNLLISLYRCAGLACRYCHGSACVFSSMTVGHVWGQVYIDGIWYVADPTSTRNSLGYIKNWNTGYFGTLNQYIQLPF